MPNDETAAFATSKEITASLPIDVPRPHPSTIRHRLAKEFNLKCYRPVKRPGLLKKEYER